MLYYRQKSNIVFSEDQPIINDCEFIHVECWTKDDSYKCILMNRVDGKSHSQVLVHDIVVRKLTYEDKDEKGEIVNIDKKTTDID